MPHNLPDDNGTFTTSELTDRFNVDPDAIPDTDEDLTLSLALALVLTDDLMGDDPVKFEAQQAIVEALAALDDRFDTTTEISYDAPEITVKQRTTAD